MPAPSADPDRARAVAVLRDGLRREREFVKVHAAEALLRHGLDDGVRRIFLAEAEHAGPRYRVVVWRVLAQAATTASERRRSTDRIRAAALDEHGPDRAHGIEAWAKLRLSGRPLALRRLAVAAGPLRPYACWALAATGGSADKARLAALLRGRDRAARPAATYALMSFEDLGRTAHAELLRFWQRGRERKRAPWLLGAAHAHGIEPAPVLRALRGELRASGDAQRPIAAAIALCRLPDPSLLPQLRGLLDHRDPDTRIRAAEAVLACSPRPRRAARRR